MMRFRASIAAVLLAVSCCTVAYAQQTDSGVWLDSYVNGLPAGKHFRGNVIAERDGQIIVEKSYGLAVEEWRIPNTRQTRFELASLTKQFTAVAILQLVDAGKLSVADPISKYYKSAPQTWQGITIQQLLTHTSGLPNNRIADFTKGITTPYTPDELIQTFRDRPLAFAPGTKWAYTNTEYYLLAWLIENLSGEKFNTYLAHHIFEPLGMTHSGLSGTLAVIPEMAEGYTFENDQLRMKDYFDRSLEIGAGGVHTTTGDMLLWNKALDKPGLLSAHSLELMFTVHPPGAYGYGWFVENTPRRKIYHEGGDPGYAAFEARYPDQHLVILVLANVEDAPVRDIATGLADHILAERISAAADKK